MEFLFIMIIGLCIGSFLNVCIYRIAREESIAFPPSHCTNCGYELKVKDLIPVLSYLFLKGKCRQCNEKISIRYPIVEILNAVIYMMLFINLGFTFKFFIYCILVSLLIVIAFIDFETKYVYSSTVLFGILIGVIFVVHNWIVTKSIPLDNIAGAAIGFLVIWVIVVLTHGMGEGDIDIALICGLFLGVKGILLTLFCSFVIGGIVAAIILILKLKDKKAEIAFGPYLAIGAVITMIWGDMIINAYIKYLFM